MATKKHRDPADKIAKQDEQAAIEEGAKRVDVRRLTMQDFKSVPPSVATSPDPFDGFPTAEPMTMDIVMYDLEAEEEKVEQRPISPTYVVALNPSFHVAQDPSGKSRSVFVKGKERMVDIKTPHSRMLVDRPNGKNNIDVVFDRVLQLEDGRLRYAVVPNHYVRAQLVFKQDDKGKIREDERYLLLDTRQFARLRQSFLLFVTPAARIERVARAISGEGTEDPELVLQSAPRQSIEAG